MGLVILNETTHLDHGLSQEILDWLVNQYSERNCFFIETISLPKELGTLPCGLHGPIMGDAPVPEDEVHYADRNGRGWTSRLVDRPSRDVSTLTVIGGPHAGHLCILYTAYGGPEAPQESGDPDCRDPKASKAFWDLHALSA